MGRVRVYVVRVRRVRCVPPVIGTWASPSLRRCRVGRFRGQPASQSLDTAAPTTARAAFGVCWSTYPPLSSLPPIRQKICIAKILPSALDPLIRRKDSVPGCDSPQHSRLADVLSARKQEKKKPYPLSKEFGLPREVGTRKKKPGNCVENSSFPNPWDLVSLKNGQNAVCCGLVKIYRLRSRASRGDALLRTTALISTRCVVSFFAS